MLVFSQCVGNPNICTKDCSKFAIRQIRPQSVFRLRFWENLSVDNIRAVNTIVCSAIYWDLYTLCQVFKLHRHDWVWHKHFLGLGLFRISHDDVIKWKHFQRYRSPVNSPHKGEWRGALMFSLISAWINGWVNNSEAGDLRRDRTNYDVTVMFQMGGLQRQRYQRHDLKGSGAHLTSI